MKILTGLLPQDEGEIFVDDQKLNKIDIQNYRPWITTVIQMNGYYLDLYLVIYVSFTRNLTRLELKNVPADVIADVLTHPRWLYNYLTNPALEFANVAGSVHASISDRGGLLDYTAKQFDPSVDWDDVAWMIEQWDGPFLIKGIVNPEDARRAVDIGVNGIIISNHGGRQLDYMPPTIEVLPDIVQAVAGRAEVLLDSGVRRGTDVIKALALGAAAVMIGRPYLYALAAGGEAGVDRMLDLLRSEIIRDMSLLGCAKITDLTPEFIHRP